MSLSELDGVLQAMERTVADPYDLRLEDLDIPEDEDEDMLEGLEMGAPLEPFRATSSRIRAYSSCDFDSLVFSEAIEELDVYAPPAGSSAAGEASPVVSRVDAPAGAGAAAAAGPAPTAEDGGGGGGEADGPGSVSVSVSGSQGLTRTPSVGTLSEDGTVHSEWKGETAGGCFNFPTFRHNPQFPLFVRAGAGGGETGSCEVRVSITLEQKGTLHGIGASVVDACGAGVVYKPSEATILGSSQKYVREPTVTFETTLAARAEPYTVLATTFMPGAEAQFSVSAQIVGAEDSGDGDGPSVRLGVPSELDGFLESAYPYVSKLRSSWEGATAGGCVNFATVKDNPQFLLMVSEPSTRVFLRLVHEPLPGSVDAEFPVAFYVTDKRGKKLQTLLSEDVVLSSGQYATQREVVRLGVLEPKVYPYTCIATTFAPGSEATFSWEVWSSAPVVFEEYHRVAPTASSFGMKYLASLSAAWKGATAGGSVNEATVGNNPQFYLYTPEETNVVVELEQVGTAWPIAVYTLNKGGMLGRSIAKADIVSSSGKYLRESAVLCQTKLVPLWLDTAAATAAAARVHELAGRDSVAGSPQLLALAAPGLGDGEKRRRGSARVSMGDAELLPYTVLPSTFSPMQEGEFTVSVYSDAPVRLEPAVVGALFTRRGLVYHASARGEWKGVTAGGCPNYATAANNPQFQLVALPDGVSSRARVVVVLEQDYHMVEGGEGEPGETRHEIHSIGAYVCDNSGQRLEYLYEESIMAATTKYCHNATVETSEAYCKTNQPYTVFASTFLPDKEASFTVRVFSDMEVSLTVLPVNIDPLESMNPVAELHGIWKGETAGGAINFESSVANPQFSLFIPPRDQAGGESERRADDGPVNVRLTLVRQAPPMETAIPIGFVVADIDGARVSSDLGSRALVGDSGPFVNVPQVSVTLSLMPRATPYTIMPSTFDPGVSAVFTLQVRSADDSVTLSKWRAEHDVQAMALQSLSHTVEVSGEWSGLTAGGCINFPTSALNPLYGLTVSGSNSVTVHVLLRQGASSGNGNGNGDGTSDESGDGALSSSSSPSLVPIGILVADIGDANPRTTPIRPEQALATSGDFLNAQEVRATATLKPSPHPYLLFCSTFAPNQEARFEVVVSSDAPVTLTEFPEAEVNSPSGSVSIMRETKPPLKDVPPSSSVARVSEAAIASVDSTVTPDASSVVRVHAGSGVLNPQLAHADVGEPAGNLVVAEAGSVAPSAKVAIESRSTSMCEPTGPLVKARVDEILRQSADAAADPRHAVDFFLAQLDNLIDLADDMVHGRVTGGGTEVDDVAVVGRGGSVGVGVGAGGGGGGGEAGAGAGAEAGAGSGSGSVAGSHLSPGGGQGLNARQRKLSSNNMGRMSIVPRTQARSSTLHQDIRRLSANNKKTGEWNGDRMMVRSQTVGASPLAGRSAFQDVDTDLGAKQDVSAYESEPVPVAVIKQLLQFLFSLFDRGTPSLIIGNVLTQPDGMLVRALAQTVTVRQADTLAMPLVHVFGSQSRLMTLVETLIEYEIERTHEDAGATLFRSNTLTTKVMSAYCTVTGSEFLFAVLDPVLSTIEADPGKFKIEKYGDNPPENIAALLSALNMLVDAIFSSVDAMPCEVRSICHALASRARTKFPKNEVHVLAGLVFLRFICPALVTPQKYGLRREPLTRAVQSGLVMVSKTIQRLANGVMFPGSEPYMVQLNAFIEGRSLQLTNFLSELAGLDFPTRTELNGTAVCHFEAVEVDELSFVQGQRIVDIVTTDSPEWMCGSVNGKTGLFPAEFARIQRRVVPRYDVTPLCELTTAQRNALIDIIRDVMADAEEALVAQLSASYRVKKDEVEIFRMEKDHKAKSTFRQRLLAKLRRQ